MAAYQDGDSRTINGVTYIRTNGAWLPHANSQFGAPTLPLQYPTGVADLTGKTIANQKNSQTLPYDVTTAKNTAAKSGSEADIAANNAKISDINLRNQTGQIPGNSGLKGQDYLNSLPSGMADTILAMDQGRLGVPINLRNPQMVQMVMAANHYDPSFDATKYNTRLAALRGGAVGRLGSSDNSLNTAIAHAGILWDQATGTPQQPGPAGSDLGIGPISLGVNALKNWENKGSPGLVTYNDTAGKLAGEEAQAYGMGTQGERDSLLTHFDPNMPLASKQAAIKNAMDLFASKMASNLHQYQWGNMGNQKPSLDLLDPSARATLQRIAPEVLDKYFSNQPDPMAAAIGMSSLKNGGPGAPPTGGGTPPSPGYVPPPSGATNGAPTASTDGYNNTPDPQSAAFWNNAIHQGTPYGVALSQWQSQLGGKSVVTPPDPDAYKAAVDYVQKNPNIDYNPAQSVLRNPLNPTAQAMNAVAQNPAATFGVDYYNDLGAGLPLAAMGDQGARYNAISSALNPHAAQLGNTLGTIGGVLGFGKLLDGAVAAGDELPMVGSYLRGTGIAPPQGLAGDALTNATTSAALRRGLTSDVLYGGVNGAAQNPNNPAAGAAGGMALMAGGNMAGRYIVGNGMRALADTPIGQSAINTARGMFAAQPFQPPLALTKGENLIFNRTGGDPLAGITSNLQDASNLGLPYALADSSPQLRQLAGKATRMSPDAYALAESTLQPRQLGQGERAIGQINNNLAPVGDVPTMIKQANAAASVASKPAYDQAFSQPAPLLSQNPILAGILDRPGAQAGLRRAYTNMLNDGVNPADTSIGTDSNGNPVFTGNPTWKALHYVRQGLDDEIQSAIDPVTGGVTPGMSQAQGSLIGLRKSLDEQIGTLNPAFKSADAQYAQIASQGSAAQQGANATALGVTPEQAQAGVTKVGDNLPYYQQGYASNLADQVERQNFTGNPYNLVGGSIGKQAKLSAIFPDGADQFNRAAGLEGDMSKTYQEALGGSQTAQRTQTDKTMDNADMALDLLQSSATGTAPWSMGMTVLRKAGLFDNWPGQMTPDKASQIAPMLLNTDPNANLIMLDQLQRQSMLRQNYVNQTQMMGGMFAAPVIYGASQQ